MFIQIYFVYNKILKNGSLFLKLYDVTVAIACCYDYCLLTPRFLLYSPPLRAALCQPRYIPSCTTPPIRL